MQRAKPAVIYHASCPDGFGAAWAAHRVLGEQAQYLPMNHGYPIPQMDDDARVYILDFSFDREGMGKLHRKHGQDHVILLDHHITGAQELSELPNCHIDLSKSGAVLSWEHFHPGSAVPTLLLYVQDKDLWTWELPDSRAVSAYLSSREMDFATWDNIARDLEPAQPQQRLRREPVGQAVRRRRAPGRRWIHPAHPEPATGGSGRAAAVSDHVAGLQAVHHWPDLPAVARVTATRQLRNQSSTESRYYLLSHSFTPERCNDIVHSHWGDENQLHSILGLVSMKTSAATASGTARKVWFRYANWV